MSKNALEDIKKYYTMESTALGRGAFGKVFKAVSLTDKSFQVAIKVLNKKNMSKNDIKEINGEVQILNQLDHPNIVKYFEVYEDKKLLYIVMEYWSGSNLYEKLTYQGIRYNETDCAKLAQQLLLAVHHCHSSKITHRDIKLENIMLTEDNHTKLIDFGLSKNATQQEMMKSMTGTPYYMAPEVFENEKYGSAVDIWSLGVVLFTWLGGYRPFSGKNVKEISKSILEWNYKFHPREWSSISRDAKDLISQMLNKDPNKRITAEKALKHPWFGLITEIKLVSTVKKEQMVKTHVWKKLFNYDQESVLKRSSIELLVNMLSADEKNDLEKEFNKFDTSKTGVISDKEFIEKVKEQKPEVNHKDIKKMVKELDFTHWKEIKYKDFMVATIDVKIALTKDRLQTIFSKFDLDNNQIITEENLISALDIQGFSLTKSQASEMISMYDTASSGFISKLDFKKMMIKT